MKDCENNSDPFWQAVEAVAKSVGAARHALLFAPHPDVHRAEADRSHRLVVVVGALADLGQVRVPAPVDRGGGHRQEAHGLETLGGDVKRGPGFHRGSGIASPHRERSSAHSRYRNTQPSHRTRSSRLMDSTSSAMQTSVRYRPTVDAVGYGIRAVRGDGRHARCPASGTGAIREAVARRRPYEACRRRPSSVLFGGSRTRIRPTLRGIRPVTPTRRTP